MYDCYYNFHNNLSYSVHVGKLLHSNFDVVEDKDEYNFQFSTIKIWAGIDFGPSPTP